MEDLTVTSSEDPRPGVPTEPALRASLSVLPLGVLTLDAGGTILLAEGGVFPLLGCEPRGLVGAHLGSSPLPGWIKQAGLQALEGKAPSSRGEGYGGGIFEVSFRPVLGPSGALRWVVCSLHELSQVARRAGDQREAKVRREFEELADLTRGVYWEAQAAPLRFTHVSDQARRLLGFLPEAWLHSGFWERRIHPEDRSEAVTQCLSAAEQLRPHQMDYRMVAADGRSVWVRDFVTASRNPEGQVRLRGVMVDLSHHKALMEEARLARKSAEEAMRRARFLSKASRRLSASLDFETTMRTISQVAIPRFTDGCALFLLEGGHFKQVVASHRDPDVQQRAEALFARYPPDPNGAVGMGKVARTGVGFLYEQVPTGLLDRIARSPEHLRMLRSLKLKSYMAVPLMTHGEVLGVMAFATSRRRFGPQDFRTAEELGQRSAAALENARLFQKAQQAVQLREDFLAIAAHELRTPLTTLKLMLSSLETKLKAGGAPPLSLLQRAQRSAERLKGLVTDLLDVSQLEAGKLMLHPQGFSLGALLAQQVEDFRQADPSHRILTGPLDPSLSIRGDPARISQVVANLLDNALKYSPAGTEVRVSLWRGDGEAVFSVADSGIGIPQAQQEEIFGRFSKASTAPISRYGGLGLGLYISRSVVERHGGRIWVESGEGHGATFYVSLPLAEPEPATAGDRSGPASAPR